MILYPVLDLKLHDAAQKHQSSGQSRDGTGRLDSMHFCPIRTLTPTFVFRVWNPTLKVLGSRAGYSITAVLQEALFNVAIQQ